MVLLRIAVATLVAEVHLQLTFAIFFTSLVEMVTRGVIGDLVAGRGVDFCCGLLLFSGGLSGVLVTSFTAIYVAPSIRFGLAIEPDKRCWISYAGIAREWWWAYLLIWN